MRSLRLQSLDVQPAATRLEVASAIAYVRRGERVPLEQFLSLTFIERGRVDMHRPEHNSRLKQGAENRMYILDKLPPEWRALANELGLPVVDAFYREGVPAKTAKRLIMLARGQQPDGRPAAFGNRRVGKAGGN